VAATHGQVVTYAGTPATTYFFSSSGGYTENVENVWLGSAPKPWLKGVPDPYDGVAGNPEHRWSSTLSTAAATARLGSLVKGQLVGITVTRHGVSPRVVSAQVIGTQGRTEVTGPQLQSAFGLLSTYATFTTISSASGVASASAQRVATGGRLAAAEAGFEVLAIHGAVFPAQRGSGAAIQVRTRGGWRTVNRIRLGVRGAYVAPLPKAGSYRVLYRGLGGPAVTVG
jgi:stage II sporulation protein D